MGISNRHSIVPFVAGKTAPLTQQRLAKVGYKTTAKNPAKFASVAVSVPFIQPDDITNNLQALLPHIGTMLENAQDGVIRSLYEASEGSLKEVSDSDISVESCIAWLNAEAAGDRLTKEAIQSWFDTCMQESLYVLIAEKLGFTSDPTENQDREIRKHCKIYKDVFSMLAGGKTVLQDAQIRGCKTALSLIDSDPIASKLSARIANMERKPVIADMLEL